MTWLIATASLAGVVMNIHKMRICFAVWFFSNAAWAVVDFAHEMPAQGALQVVEAGLCVWGWCKWAPKTESKE